MANINIMAEADKAPVLPSSKVVARALGISATIPENIIKDIPLPIPLCVICSPSHIKKTVPATKVITVVNLKNDPESIITTWEFSNPTATPYPWIVAKMTVPYLVNCVIYFLPISPWFFKLLKVSETPVSNWIIIEDEIYGMIPRANIAILLTAPPEKILNIPRRPLWAESIIVFKDSGSIPGKGMYVPRR